MTYERMLERVRYEGAYLSRERAEGPVRTVLAALGRQRVGHGRVDLAQALPVDAALALTAQAPATGQLTGGGFVKGIAARTGSSPAIARWDTGALLTVVTGPGRPGPPRPDSSPARRRLRIPLRPGRTAPAPAHRLKTAHARHLRSEPLSARFASPSTQTGGAAAPALSSAF
ncbi:DUF2267 domain-containing protein [Streptomyces vinaceus]|uniref:DUF2267 domain-containing protein n=1 Tax=Streptomyces vinaceus TaxID=1960 RepID=UPI0036A4E7B2